MRANPPIGSTSSTSQPNGNWFAKLAVALSRLCRHSVRGDCSTGARSSPRTSLTFQNRSVCAGASKDGWRAKCAGTLVSRWHLKIARL